MILALDECNALLDVQAEQKQFGSSPQEHQQQNAKPRSGRKVAAKGAKSKPRPAPAFAQESTEVTNVIAPAQASAAPAASTSPYEITSTGDPLTGKPVAPPAIPAGLTVEQAEEFVRIAGQAYNLASTYFPAVVAKASGLPAEIIDARVGARYLDNVITEIDAADSLEKQMLEQICALHLTFGQLSLKAAGMQETEAFRVVMEVALRCQAEHRRTSLALVQYRLGKQKLAAGAAGANEAAASGGLDGGRG